MKTKSIDTSRLRSFLQLTGRLTCIASMVWLSVIVVIDAVALRENYQAKLSSLNSSAMQQGELTSDLEAPELIPMKPGSWSFANSELSILRRDCDDAELEVALAKFRDPESFETTHPHDAQFLVELAESYQAKRVQLRSTKTNQDLFIWQVDESNFRLRMATSNDARPTLMGLALATQLEHGWQLTVLKPRTEGSHHLMPFPGDATTICSRRNRVGELQFELVETTQSDSELLQHWKQQGWELKRTPWGGNNDFSFMCIRNEKAIYAWSDSNSNNQTIMLTAVER